jgi:hypothetical protein
MRVPNGVFIVLAACVALTAGSIGLGTAKTHAAPHRGSPPPTGNCAAIEAYQGQSVGPPTIIDQTCARIPLGIPGDVLEQGPTDVYSWLTFVAMNWPVVPGACQANLQASILHGAQSPTWLSYLFDDDVFVAPGSSPTGWCYTPTKLGRRAAFASAAAGAAAKRAARLALLPPRVRALAEKHPEVTMFLSHNAKGARVRMTAAKRGAALDPHLQTIVDATGQAVTAQNGRFVRYTVNMNFDEYKYVIQKSLWNNAGQAAAGNLKFPSSDPKTGDVGAMEFKAAWKVLGPGDDPSHFFTMKAIVYNDASGDVSPGPNPVTVGLAGLHITHKTSTQSDWLWSTFEQTDLMKSFNNPHCSASQCPPNVETAPTPYVELDPKTGKPLNKPVQVVPIIPITKDTQSLNASFQKLLAGTPWAHYRLIATQWVGETPGFHPTSLGNPVLETFVKDVQPYSCMGCHTQAVTNAGSNANFSWMMLEAQGTLPPIAPSPSPSSRPK